MKLYAQNDTVNVENPVSCVFSTINPAINADELHCQAIISVPNGMHFTSLSDAERESGQCIMNFNLKPGELSKVNVNFATENLGEYVISGVAYYYFGDNKTDAGTTNFSTTVHIVQRGAPTNGATPGLTSLEAGIAILACVVYLCRRK
jgi:hypothetical protein